MTARAQHYGDLYIVLFRDLVIMEYFVLKAWEPDLLVLYYLMQEQEFKRLVSCTFDQYKTILHRPETNWWSGGPKQIIQQVIKYQNAFAERNIFKNASLIKKTLEN